MCIDSATVLVAGGSEERVVRVADLLAGALSVRTFVATEGENRSATDVEVVVFADRAADPDAVEPLPDDCARVAVFEDSDAFDHDQSAAFDRVLVEPLVPDDFRTTVASLARRVRYDRRLRECAELAARCGRTPESGGPPTEPPHLCDEIVDAKAELDGLVEEFSREDFRQAFQTLAAD